MTVRIVAAFMPLVDCATLVAARELGFTAREGIELELVKEPSWASLRDHLSLGYVDCAHALAPLPVASALGVGHVRVDCFVPFVLSRGGNAITVSNDLFARLEQAGGSRALADPASAGAGLAAVVAARREPLTLGMVFPFSNHNFDLRYWLASAGVHPDRDVRLVAIPPPLMVESLRAGHVDGFCVGEPWNSLAVAEGLGRIIVTKSQLFPHGIEKVLAVRAALEDEPDRLGPLLRALAAAAAWADDPANRSALAALLARREHVDAPHRLVHAALSGRLQLGGGRSVEDRDFLYVQRHAANVPLTTDALWIYAQMARWGQLAHGDEQQARAARVFRPDLYRRYIEVTTAPPASTLPFDASPFSAADIDAYLERFDLFTPFIGQSTAFQS